MSLHSKRFSGKQWQDRQMQAARSELDRNKLDGVNEFRYFHFGNSKVRKFLEKNAVEVTDLSCDELFVRLK